MTKDFLILGDFRGRAERTSVEPIARRRLWRVDRDEVDAVIAAMTPEARVVLDPSGSPVTIHFASLDDFHPDRLVARVPLLQQLRELRAGLAAPGRIGAPPREPARTQAADAAAAMSGGNLLDRILDDAPGSTSAAPADELSEFVNRAVRPHVIGEIGSAQKEQLAKVDDAMSAALRVILHDASFQALESLWRAVDLLTRRVDTSEDLHITLVDVTRAELVAALDDDSDASAAGLRTLLEMPATGGGEPRWSFAVVAHSFDADEIARVARLARLASETGVPCIAAAEPTLAGAESFGDGSDIDDWSSAPPAAWDDLRRSDAARWLCLALPRFLARTAYGAKSEPCEVVAFEELDESSSAHESFLWANPALLCALVLGESAADGDAWATHGTVDRLPFQLVRVNGEAQAIPCAETLLSQRSMMHLLDRGFTPLASERDGDAIRIPRLQSIAVPPAPLPIGEGKGAR